MSESDTAVSRRPCTRAYWVLIALTFATYVVGELGLSGLSAALLVLASALFKGHLVGDFFMGLHGLRGPWRWVILLWLALVGGLITLAFTLTSQAAGSAPWPAP